MVNETGSTGHEERDPFLDKAIELASKYETALGEDEAHKFVAYMRGKLNPTDLDEQTRENFDKLNKHVHIEALLDRLSRSLHEDGIPRQRRDNRAAFMASHISQEIAPQLDELFEETRNRPHGFGYNRDPDSQELEYAEAFCLGVVRAAVDIRQRTIEGLYGGPSNLVGE